MIRLRYLLLNLFMIYFFGVESDAYRILGIFPLNIRSNNILFESVMKALAKAGHQVDVVTHFQLIGAPENYKSLFGLDSTMYSVTNNFTMEQIEQVRYQNPAYYMATEYGNRVCEKVLPLWRLQNLIKNPPNDPPYDLVITEALAANCFMGLGFVWKVPVITISSTIDLPWAGRTVGNPPSTAFVPYAFSLVADVSTFLDRLQNTLSYYSSKYRFFWYTEIPQTEMMRKYLSPDIPNIREVEKSVALMFINSHCSFFGVRPITPALVEIGGIQVEQNEEILKSSINYWLDGSKNGVIYFSLGSMLTIDSLPKATLSAICSAFERISPIKVLMQIQKKGSLPRLKGKNIFFLDSIPQIPLLRHNNTRLFVTLGGRNSVIEALYYGVPMLGLPMTLDQFLNMAIVTKKNMGLQMDYRTLSESSFFRAITSLVYDKKYRDAAKRESQIFRDRPMNASQTAVFWVEYVLRYGANPLRAPAPAMDLYSWQVDLLDVYGFLIIFFILFVTGSIFVIVMTYCFAAPKKGKKKISKRKNK